MVVFSLAISDSSTNKFLTWHRYDVTPEFTDKVEGDDDVEDRSRRVRTALSLSQDFSLAFAGLDSLMRPFRTGYTSSCFFQHLGSGCPRSLQ